jgi:hypothetical protein
VEIVGKKKPAKPAGRKVWKFENTKSYEQWKKWRLEKWPDVPLDQAPPQEPAGPIAFAGDSGDGEAGERAAMELLRQAASVDAGRLVTSERRFADGAVMVSGTYIPPAPQRRTRVPEARTLEIIRDCQVADMEGRRHTGVARKHGISSSRLRKILSQHRDLYKS